MISKKLFFILVVVVLALLGFSVWLGSLVVKTTRQNSAGPSDYSAVYLTTGDIYYGKMHWFPRLYLTDVWVLQRSVAPDSQFGIAQFSRAFWQPVDEVYLNSDNVVLWTRLRNDSQLVSYFNNPATAGFQGPAESPAVPAPSNAEGSSVELPPTNIPFVPPPSPSPPAGELPSTNSTP